MNYFKNIKIKSIYAKQNSSCALTNLSNNIYYWGMNRVLNLDETYSWLNFYKPTLIYKGCALNSEIHIEFFLPPLGLSMMECKDFKIIRK